MGMGNNHNNNMNGFQHQHPNRPNFTQPSNDEDAYFRKPVNPGRHQNRQRRNRPSDYREL
ncbi:RING finger protein [Apiospora saccharicola]|uniref:RING finger protein n=1 Tax=Apiospora saccharicola TaxID=335842 RepID=A0ABR1WEJ8_9PEZI